jgi:hypothetical protein
VQIEANVMSHNHRLADEAFELRPNRGQLWGARGHFIRDTGEALDERRDCAARVHHIRKGLKFVSFFIETRRPHLDDAVSFRVQAGGFKVQGDVSNSHNSNIRADISNPTLAHPTKRLSPIPATADDGLCASALTDSWGR